MCWGRFWRGVSAIDCFGLFRGAAATKKPLPPSLSVPHGFPLAIRVSNVVSLLVVFAAGYTWRTHADTNPWKTGLLLSSVCLAMVVVYMLLGG